MIGFVTTKKQISTVLLVVLLAVILLVAVITKAGWESKAETPLPAAAETADRIAFLKQLGYTVDPAQEEQGKQIEIPHIFSDVYETYQQLQLQAGYDLTKYAGKPATLYTYQLVYPTRNDVYAHLIVYDGSVIGGDISALSVSDGFIRPLLAEF